MFGILSCRQHALMCAQRNDKVDFAHLIGHLQGRVAFSVQPRLHASQYMARRGKTATVADVAWEWSVPTGRQRRTVLCRERWGRSVVVWCGSASVWTRRTGCTAVIAIALRARHVGAPERDFERQLRAPKATAATRAPAAARGLGRMRRARPSALRRACAAAPGHGQDTSAARRARGGRGPAAPGPHSGGRLPFSTAKCLSGS